MRSVMLPCGRRVPLAAYVAGWKRLKTMPPDQLVRGWSHFAETAEHILGDYHRGMHDRINRRGRLAVPESRVHPSYWGAARTPRVILETFQVRCMPRSARRRLESRIREAD